MAWTTLYYVAKCLPRSGHVRGGAGWLVAVPWNRRVAANSLETPFTAEADHRVRWRYSGREAANVMRLCALSSITICP